ncbi:hypothetical protein B0H12DRAFT_90024 [Mycena haematopus]|nr:hypothetical protein B0H12DRAFT_90024 [Mycena haematopus]
MMKVINGERPQRPSSSPAMSDILWNCVSTYWAQEPTIRPGTQIVAQNMIWPPLPVAVRRPGSPEISERSLTSAASSISVSSMTDSSSDLVDRKSDPIGSIARALFEDGPSAGRSHYNDPISPYHPKSTTQGFNSLPEFSWSRAASLPPIDGPYGYTHGSATGSTSSLSNLEATFLEDLLPSA